MEAIIPYLTFNGNAAEALDFYANALNGEVVYKQTYGESPMQSSEEDKNKIMHASFKAGELNFLVSDGNASNPVSCGGNNLSLSLNFENLEESTILLLHWLMVEKLLWNCRTLFGVPGLEC
jgi:PhnB protein